MMSSIKGRLLAAFLAVVTALSIGGTVFFFIQYRLTEQYKSVSDTMIAEYRLVDESSNLIRAFNARLKSAGISGDGSVAQLRVAEQEIQNLTLFLNTKIVDTESRSNYFGFKASIETLQAQVDASLARFDNGSGIQNYVSDYAEANKDYSFVCDNGTTLIFSQLKYTSSMQDVLHHSYLVSLYIGLGILLAFLVSCIFFVLEFANHISRPLRALTIATKQIADGNMNFSIDQTIRLNSTEIGMLASSFISMEEKLRDKVAQIDASNKELATNAQEVNAKNSELEELNKFMVDRELKMIELKKEIVTLSAKIASHE